MFDERDLYINQVLNHYKIPHLENNALYTVNWTYNGKNQHYRYFSHNEGLKFVQDYIKQLQGKLEEYQHIERIIQAARKENDNV